jgi:hypothetical protein
MRYKAKEDDSYRIFMTMLQLQQMHEYRSPVHGTPASTFQSRIWQSIRISSLRTTTTMHFSTLIFASLAACAFYVSALPVEPKRGEL